MGIAEWILLILLILPFFNLIFLFVYCRVAEKVDCRKFEKRKQATSSETKIDGLMDEAKSKGGELNKYLYGWTRYCSILVGRFPSNRVRNRVFRYVFRMKATKNTVINGGCELRSPWNIKAGNCIIGNNTLLDGRSGIEIGDNVVFGADVRVWTMEHDVNDPLFRVTEEHCLPVKIDNHVWICSGSSILQGVHVKQGAVVASRACIAKDCDAYGIYAGIPAKKIGDRTQDLRYVLSGKPAWHFY